MRRQILDDELLFAPTDDADEDTRDFLQQASYRFSPSWNLLTFPFSRC